MELRTNWSESGTDIKELSRVIDELDENTHVVKVTSADIDLYSFKELTPTGYARFYSLNETSINKLEEGTGLKMIKGKISSFNYRLLNEMSDTTNLLMSLKTEDGYKIMTVSDKAMYTLLQRASLGGEASINMNTLTRNLFLADALRHKCYDMSLVYRTIWDFNMKKYVSVVFAVMGSRYERIPQKLILDTVKNLENGKGAECLRWQVDHEYTNVTLIFPRLRDKLAELYHLKDEIMPAIILYTSDVGLACFYAEAGYFIGDNSFVVTGNNKRRHIGKINEKVLVEDIEDKLLADVRKLPETLAYLANIKVSDPIALIKAIWRGCLTCIPGFVKKNLPVKKSMIEEAETLHDLTGYDIAMMFMTLQERLIGLNDASMHKLRCTCSEIPYKIKRLLDKEDSYEDETPLTLTPLFALTQEDAI